MEEERFFSGYCRCLDAARTVEVTRCDGPWTADCEFSNCPHATSCPIGQQIQELSQE